MLSCIQITLSSPPALQGKILHLNKNRSYESWLNFILNCLPFLKSYYLLALIEKKNSFSAANISPLKSLKEFMSENHINKYFFKSSVPTNEGLPKWC